MHRIIATIFAAISLSLAGCSPDLTLVEAPGIPMQISAEVAAYGTELQDLSTRASINNGVFTSFATGDDLGIIVTDASGNILADNLRYVVSRTGNAYRADANGNIIASDIYYDPSHTIIAYAPYDSRYNGCRSVDEVLERYRAVYETQYTDQSTLAKYSAADLLICRTPEWSAPRLRLTFAHALSMLLVYYNGDYADLTVDYPAALDHMYKPDGSNTYRYLTLPQNGLQVYGTAISRPSDEGAPPATSFWQTKIDMKEHTATYVSISSQPTVSYKSAGVDMGFPSGCIWAAYNLGSESAAEQTTRGGKWYDADGNERTDLMGDELHKSFDRGDYFSWGELETKYERPALLIDAAGKVTAVGDAFTTNAAGDPAVTPLVSGSEKGYYPATYVDRTYSYSPIDGNIAGTEHDVVRSKLWKGEWRIPNENEIDELMRNCDISVHDWYYEDNVRYAPWLGAVDAEGNYTNLHAENSEFYGTGQVRPYRYLVVIYKFVSKINGEVLYFPGGTWSDWSIDELACRSRNPNGNYYTTVTSEDYGGMYYFASSASHQSIDCSSYMEMEANKTYDSEGRITAMTPRIKYSTYKDSNGETVTLVGLTQNSHRYTGMLIRPVYGGKNWNLDQNTRARIFINVEKR